jgi:hypothetical protein
MSVTAIQQRRSTTKVKPCHEAPAQTLPSRDSNLNQLLDEALNETFPASDPIAIAVEFESTEETGFYNAVESRSRSEASIRR